MGYRQVPLSSRLGLSFAAERYWRVSMPDAECFMYFMAQMQRLFGQGHTLYVEGRAIDDEVAALYLEESEPFPRPIGMMDRHSHCRRFHVRMGSGLSRRLNALAARKTYAQIGERMLVYDAVPELRMDGSRLGERIVRISGAVGESSVRRFAAGPLRGHVEWVEE
jgi:hypothetical protein